MIESRWDLKPLTVRDKSANDLGAVLDFSKPDLRAPSYPVLAGPFGGACGAGAESEEEWAPVMDLARRYGFPV